MAAGCHMYSGAPEESSADGSGRECIAQAAWPRAPGRLTSSLTLAAVAAAALLAAALLGAREGRQASILTRSSGRREQLTFSEARSRATPAGDKPKSKSGSSSEACKDATAGDNCTDTAMWAMLKGISEHPEWYDGLAPGSFFRDFQSHLHEGDYGSCGKPCDVPSKGSPTLFCVTLMMPTGEEPELMKALLERNLGPFSCDGYAVISNERITIEAGSAEPVVTDVIPGSLDCPIGGRYQVRLNKDVFVRFWNKVSSDPRAFNYDWTIKLDADAVFIVDRMRGLLGYLFPDDSGRAMGRSAFLKNCKYTLYGAVEVVSRAALESYARDRMDGAPVCSSGGAGEAIVEDRFINECLKQLGADKVEAWNALQDASCHDPHWEPGFSCADPEKATFHPFKDADSYFRCYEEATSQR